MKQLFTLVCLICCWQIGSLWAQTDAQVTSVSPAAALDCDAYANGATIQIVYANTGTINLASVPVTYSVNGSPPVTETAPGLPAGATGNYVFTTPYVFPQSGVFYTIDAWTDVPGDANVANDTASSTPLLPPTLASLPFIEDFETFFPGSPGFLANGWTRGSNSFQNWSVDNGLLFTEAATGPDTNHTVGGQIFLFTEATGGVVGDTLELRTPCIDFSGTTSPRLNFWYHMHGADLGEFRVYVRDLTTGQTGLEFSLAGQQQTSQFAPWQEASLDLTAYAGNVVQILFVGERGNGVLSDIALDDILIFEPLPTDVGAVEVTPTGAGCYSAAEEIQVTFTNFGSQILDLALNPVTVTVVLDGPPPLQTYNAVVDTGSLDILDSLTITVTNMADLSTPGTFNYTVYTTLVGDSLNFNDTLLFQSVTSIQSYTIPFFEDFENFTPGTNANTNPGVFANGWTREFDPTQPFFPYWLVDNGILTSSFGTGADIDHTPTGTNWVYLETSFGPVGDSSEMRSPCITLPQGAAALDFWYHMFGPTMGTIKLYVADQTTGNLDLIWQLSGQQQTLDIDPWEKVTLSLTPYAGSAIRLVWRGIKGASFTGDMGIDDVLVYEPPPYDVEASAVLSPVPACNYTATEVVSVEIVNFGSDTLNNIVAQFSVDGNPFTPFEPVNVVLPPGDTTVYIFGTTADLSAPGAHEIIAVATQLIPLDTTSFNDTTVQTYFNYGASIVTFPYFENFESGPGGWEDTVIVAGTNETWDLGNPAKAVINGAASGVNAWVTGGLGFAFHDPGEQSYVFSPCFDLTNLTNPVVRMDIWYESILNDDGAALQYSTDGGTNWVTVGDFGDPDNWYNSNLITGQPGGGSIGWSGNINNIGSGGWISAKHDLDPLAGVSGVVFRVVFGADLTTGDEGFAFDNFEIFQKPDFDAIPTAIVEPESGCSLSATSTVTLEFTNSGVLPFDSLDISYEIGGTTVTETAIVTVNPGDTVLYTFATTVDLSVPGPYTVNIWTGLANDTSAFNDTITTTITSIQTVTQYPYIENFETGPNGWESGNVNGNGIWSFGTPQKPVINSAHSGVNAWVTGPLTGPYIDQTQSFVQGPCFDFTNLTNPEIRLKIFIEAEFSWDGAIIQSSVNNGATWQLVGAFNSPIGINWYNDNSISGLGFTSQLAGWTGAGISGSQGWITAQHQLTGLAGQPEVLIRVAFGSDFSFTDDGFAFDDVIVFDRANVDIGVTELSGFSSICVGDSVALDMSVTNFGTINQNGIPLQVAVDGPMPTTLNGTYAPILVPNDTVTYNFGTFSPAMPGLYTFAAYPTIAGDTTYFHDTAFFTIQVDTIASPPTTQNDTLCSGGNATLTLVADGNGSDIVWLDAPVGGSVVGTGDTLLTPPLGTTTTFYALATTQTSGTVGLPNNFFGAGNFFSLLGTATRFDVGKTIVLRSVRVYPDGPGVLQLNLTQGGGAPINTTVVPFGGTVGDTTITLNWYIEPGVDYRIDAAGSAVGGGLYRTTSGVSYPYELPGVISITGNTLNQASVYYFFYNWEIDILDCPSNSTPATAVLLPPIDVDLGPDGAQCAGFELNATTNGAISYVWNNDSAINTPIIQADTTGAYIVEVANGSGCTDRDTAILFIQPTPDVTAMPTVASDCDSVALSVDSVAGATYFWIGPNPNNLPVNTTEFTAYQSGNYFATVTVAGCTGRDTAVISILPGPIVDLGPNQQSCDTIFLDAGPGVDYAWSTGDSTQTVAIPPSSGGPQTISVIVTDTSGCVGDGEIVIAAANPPVVDLGPDQKECGQVTLDAGNPGDAYDWSTGENTQQITVTQSGTYIVEVTNQFSCIESDTVDVDITPLPVANAAFTGPLGGIVTFLNNSTPPGATYQWDFGDGSPIDTSAEPVHTYNATGSYLVELIVTNDCGSDTTEIIITGVVGIAENWFDTGLEVYPNPSDGMFMLQADELAADDLFVEVTDARGRILMQRQVDHRGGRLQLLLDLSDAAEGLYLLRVNGSERSGSQRLQVK